DGPASNDNLDLWEEMRLAPLLSRASAADASLVPTAAALRMATRGGAEALGLATGSLEPGRPADFVRVELADPSFVPALDDRELLAHLVWAAPSRLVTDVWVGGRPVVVDGRCTTVDVDEARRQVAERARRIRDGGR
ncbi:MAG TPA: amidohydrolase family protein, partial [Acidimicrobiales bacterium]|nr:amidohydrolase family protein [Acidimicrobiales bacterium]